MKAQQPAKTNAARLLDKARIPYRLIPYTVDEQHLDALHVAAELGENPKSVYKTLILVGDRTGHLVCVIPGNREIDLKKAAKVSGNKKVEMLHMKELLPLTGYIRGGCSPIGMKKPFPTYFQQEIADLQEVYVSAGMRGLQFAIAPEAIVKYVGGTLCDIVSETILDE